MNKDVVVIVKVDDKPKIAESLDFIIFATMFIKEISLTFSFFVESLCGLGIRVIVAL